MHCPHLYFHAPGASDVDVARGLAAASLFLQRAGVSVADAFSGDRARAAWGESGLAPLHEPTLAEMTAAETLDGALEAALAACYRGRPASLDAELRMAEGAA